MAENVPVTKMRFNTESKGGELKTGVFKLRVRMDIMKTVKTSIGITLNLRISVSF